MQDQILLDDFLCIEHDLPVTKVLKLATAEKILFCDDCILDITTEMNQLLRRFDKLLPEVALALKEIFSLKIDGRPKDELLEIVHNRGEMIAKFSDHIESQKQDAVLKIKELKSQLNKILEETQEQVVAKLDKQVVFFKNNFEMYFSKLKRHFNFSQEKATAPTVEDLCAEINACEDYDALDSKMRTFLTELEESEALVSEKNSNRNLVILDGINSSKRRLEQMAQNYPESILNVQEKTDKTFQNVIENLKKNVETMLLINNEVLNLKSLSIDSNLISYNDLGLLRKWLSSQGNSKVKLLARTGAFDYSFDDIAKLAFTPRKSIIIVRTQYGELMGCYRVASGGSITFSLTDQVVKYDMNPPTQKMGFYSITPSFHLTWKNHSRYNESMFAKVAKKGMKIIPNKTICLAEIEYFNYPLGSVSEKELLEKSIHAIQDIEVFEVENDAKKLVDLFGS